MQAMIFSAGLGTRFKPWTDKHPKALAAVNGKSLLQRNIEYLQGFGINDVVVNVHHFADQVVDTIHRHQGWGSKVTISDETDALLETGGGLKKATPLLTTDTIVLMNVDILTDLDLDKMIAYHHQHQALATLAISNRTTSRYFLFDDDNTLCGWKNIKTGEERISRQVTPLHAKAFSGVHVIQKKLLSLIQKEGRLGIVDLYLELAKTNTLKGFQHNYDHFVDVGKPEAIVVAEKMFP